MSLASLFSALVILHLKRSFTLLWFDVANMMDALRVALPFKNAWQVVNCNFITSFQPKDIYYETKTGKSLEMTMPYIFSLFFNETFSLEDCSRFFSSSYLSLTHHHHHFIRHGMPCHSKLQALQNSRFFAKADFVFLASKV